MKLFKEQGNRTTPSYVAFTDTERFIGDAARNQIAMNVTNTVFDAKRMIGRRFSDPTIQNDMKYWSFKYVIMDMTSQLLKFNTKGRQRDLHQKRSHPWY